MKKEDDPLELLKRNVALQGGLTQADWRKFRILFARGYEPEIAASLKSSIGFRELRQTLMPELFDVPVGMTGDIILGKNQRGGINRCESEHLVRHFLMVGSTGSGKTVFLAFLLLQLLLIAAGGLVFCFIKKEWRGLKRLAEKLGQEVIVCRHEHLRINPLDPQGLNPRDHINRASEFLTTSLDLPPAATHILKICITQLYQRFDLLSNPRAAPPILSELIAEVQQYDGHREAKNAIVLRLTALLANKEEMFSVRRGLPIAELARRFVVYELDGLEASYQNLLISYLVSSIFAHRVKYPSSDLVVIALDEAARLFSKKIESTLRGPSYISTMAATVRAMRISLLAFCQSLSDINESIIANSNIKAFGLLGRYQDYEQMSKCIGLTAAQTEWCKTNLQIGMQIVKLSVGWRKPFLNFCPPTLLPKDVSDAEVQASVEPLLKMVEAANTDQIVLKSAPAKTTSTSVHSDTSTDSPADLTSDEKSLLEQIRNNGDVDSAVEHYRQAGLSSKRGVLVKDSLVARKLIKETPLETGKRGRARLFLEVVNGTEGRRGGRLHNWLRDLANRWYLDRNCLTEIEKSLSQDGKTYFVDLAILWPDGRTEAVEIETHDSPRVVENVTKSLSHFDRIYILTPNKKVREAVTQRLNSAFPHAIPPQVCFSTISCYQQ